MPVSQTTREFPKQVFVSHASQDRAAVDRLVDLIVEIGAGRLQVFCTSTPGFDVPSGQDFFSYIKTILMRSSLVVHFITPAFLLSNFCMLELGAAWAQEKAFLLIAPPLTHVDLASGPLSSLQGSALASGDDRITCETGSAIFWRCRFAQPGGPHDAAARCATSQKRLTAPEHAR